MSLKTLRSMGWAMAAVFAVLGLALLGGCSKQPGATTDKPAATPAKAVQHFYTWRIHTQGTGVPNDQQLAALTPLVSDELHALLVETAEREKSRPPRKPGKDRTFVDGDLFSSLFDGPTSFVASDTETLAGDEHMIAVQLTSAQQLPALRWTDRVRVIKEHDHYVVADIEYANHWNVGSGQSLVGTLKKQARRKTAT
jgi:hypothetical protein